MATGLGFYALAGGIAGAGQGIAEEGKRDFEMMQDELRAKRAAEEAERGRRFQGEQGDLNRRQQERLQSDRLTFDEGQNDLNRRQQEKIAGMTTGAASDRAKEDAERYSDTFTGGDGYLYERPKGGGTARKIVGDDGQPVKAPATAAVKDPEKLTAKERADLIIAATKAATSEDPITGQKTFDQATYDQMVGRIPGMGDAKPAAPAAAAPPKGAGTKDDPYTATTQAEIDWFKKNAKPGDVIVVGKDRYTK